MAYSIGNVGEFNPEQESIELFLEQVHIVMEANGIEDDRSYAEHDRQQSVRVQSFMQYFVSSETESEIVQATG